MENPQLVIGFLASHNGTDAQAIVGQIEVGKLSARATTLISNNSREGAALFAKNPIHNINFHHVSSSTHEDPDTAMTEILLSEGVELVICSGFMKPIGTILLAAYPNNIWNPHPADTKKYGGLFGDAVHEAVLKAGDEYTFPTIHIVDSGIDTGKILAQGKVKIEDDDTVETLRARVQPVEIELLLGLLQERTSV